VYFFLVRSRYSSFVIATSLRAGRPRSPGSIPCRDRGFFWSQSRPALGPTYPPIQWIPVALSPRIKRLRA
jgi:hypothetical protein